MPGVLTIKELEVNGLVHAFSTLELGTVGLKHAPDPATAVANRTRFAEAVGVDPDTITVAGAVHGADVARIAVPQESVNGVDALVTDRPGIALFATYADCYPIVLWDPVHHAAGLVHAGWRGTEAGVARAAVEVMADAYGSKPKDIVAGIGPGICGECYEVGEDVATKFDARFSTPRPSSQKFLLDLAAANQAQLKAAGVRHVHTLGLCTKETAYLPSHRRDADGRRFGALVAIR
ncbi:MAG TPA: peptidoglycan editing factor PgeF [Candidatus Dormibacteraeota bacterium]|nr:peptidoglycan editing factor PgeF [Candidatus Dormibacteraeota bacterium]